MSLLAILGAGAAQGHRDTSNKNVDLHNAGVITNQERQDKRWLQEANQAYKEYVSQRNIEREDQKFERDRSAKKEDTQAERDFQLERDKFKHDQSISLENMRESGRNSRASTRNALKEREIASKGSKGSSESGGAKISDLRNLRNDAASKIDSINQQLHDPMNSSMDEGRKASLLSELDRAERARGDLTLQINQSLKNAPAAPNLQGLLNQSGK